MIPHGIQGFFDGIKVIERKWFSLNKGIIQLNVNEKEKKLIDMIRSTEYGEIKIIVQDKLPIRVEELKKSIKL